MQRGVPDAVHGALGMRQIPHNALNLPHQAAKLRCAVLRLRRSPTAFAHHTRKVLALTTDLGGRQESITEQLISQAT